MLFTGVVEYPLALVLVCLLRRVPEETSTRTLPLKFGVALAAGALTAAVSLWGSRIDLLSIRLASAGRRDLSLPEHLEGATAVCRRRLPHVAGLRSSDRPRRPSVTCGADLLRHLPRPSGPGRPLSLAGPRNDAPWHAGTRAGSRRRAADVFRADRSFRGRVSRGARGKVTAGRGHRAGDWLARRISGGRAAMDLLRDRPCRRTYCTEWHILQFSE